MHERPHCLRLFPHSSLPNPAEVILTAAAVEAPRLVFLRILGTVGNISPWKERLHLVLTLLSLQRGRGGCKVGIGLCRGGKEANLKCPNWPNLCCVWVSTLGLVVLGTRSVSCLPAAVAEGGELPGSDCNFSQVFVRPTFSNCWCSTSVRRKFKTARCVFSEEILWV